jgi:transketolase
MALAMRMDAVIRRWIYVVMGDGELDEGNVWEAAMLASKYKLGNIIVIVDRNNIQLDGLTENVMPLEDLKAKWESFGWHVIEIDGNNMSQIINACALGRAVVDQPVVIIAHTVPGKGVDFMEYDYRWHGIPPGVENFEGEPPKAKQAEVALHELRTLRGKIRSEAD